jgi:hypothetical protein
MRWPGRHTPLCVANQIKSQRPHRPWLSPAAAAGRASPVRPACKCMSRKWSRRPAPRPSSTRASKPSSAVQPEREANGHNRPNRPPPQRPRSRHRPPLRVGHHVAPQGGPRGCFADAQCCCCPGGPLTHRRRRAHQTSRRRCLTHLVPLLSPLPAAQFERESRGRRRRSRARSGRSGLAWERGRRRRGAEAAEGRWARARRARRSLSLRMRGAPCAQTPGAVRWASARASGASAEGAA